MAEQEDLIEANRAFYGAFESLDLAQMERVWLREPRIICIHPGWRMLTGWGPVMMSWERIFDNTFEMTFKLGDLSVMISGDLAVVVLTEDLTQRNYDGVSKSQVLTTNVFERVGGKWWMVLHHGSPILAPPDNEPLMQ